MYVCSLFKRKELGGEMFKHRKRDIRGLGASSLISFGNTTGEREQNDEKLSNKRFSLLQ